MCQIHSIMQGTSEKCFVADTIFVKIQSIFKDDQSIDGIA